MSSCLRTDRDSGIQFCTSSVDTASAIHLAVSIRSNTPVAARQTSRPSTNPTQRVNDSTQDAVSEKREKTTRPELQNYRCYRIIGCNIGQISCPTCIGTSKSSWNSPFHIILHIIFMIHNPKVPASQLHGPVAGNSEAHILQKVSDPFRRFWILTDFNTKIKPGQVDSKDFHLLRKKKNNSHSHNKFWRWFSWKPNLNSHFCFLLHSIHSTFENADLCFCFQPLRFGLLACHAAAQSSNCQRISFSVDTFATSTCDKDNDNEPNPAWEAATSCRITNRSDQNMLVSLVTCHLEIPSFFRRSKLKLYSLSYRVKGLRGGGGVACARYFQRSSSHGWHYENLDVSTQLNHREVFVWGWLFC